MKEWGGTRFRVREKVGWASQSSGFARVRNEVRNGVWVLAKDQKERRLVRV